jgi:hypothetical protein
MKKRIQYEAHTINIHYCRQKNKGEKEKEIKRSTCEKPAHSELPPCCWPHYTIPRPQQMLHNYRKSRNKFWVELRWRSPRKFAW